MDIESTVDPELYSMIVFVLSRLTPEESIFKATHVSDSMAVNVFQLTGKSFDIVRW